MSAPWPAINYRDVPDEMLTPYGKVRKQEQLTGYVCACMGGDANAEHQPWCAAAAIWWPDLLS